MSRKKPSKKELGSVTEKSGNGPEEESTLGGVDMEPTVERRTLPVVWICALVVLLYWGDVYVMYHGGDLMGKGGSFPRDVYHPVPTYVALEAMNPKIDLGPIALGEMLYAQRGCAACHQANGLGAPPNPPLAGSDWVNVEGPNRLIRIVLNGLTGPIDVNGKTYNSVMVPWRDVLNDEEIAAILSFIGNSWGNQSSLVTPEQVAKIRDETASRGGRNWTAAELLNIPLQ